VSRQAFDYIDVRDCSFADPLLMAAAAPPVAAIANEP
jgi:hypothetical protein